MGLQAIDREAIAPVFTRLKGAAEGTSNAAVVVPTSWMRSLPPRGRQSAAQGERAARCVPVAPQEAPARGPRPNFGSRSCVCRRWGAQTAPGSGRHREGGGFPRDHLQHHRYPTRSRDDPALCPGPADSSSDLPLLLIQLEPGFLSLMLLVGGTPRLLRTKPLPSMAAVDISIERELRLNLEFIRDKIGLGGEIEVKLVCDDPVMDSELRRWMAELPQLAPFVEPSPPPCGPSTVAGRIGAARLAPALAVVTGEVR